jgi:Flp pilus assembly protein TadB
MPDARDQPDATPDQPDATPGQPEERSGAVLMRTQDMLGEQYRNVEQEIITVSADKVRLALNEYLERVESRTAWVAPLGVFVTLLATLLTTRFEDAAGLSKEVWQALFLFFAVASFGWLVRVLVTRRASMSKEEFIEKLKGHESEQ